MRSGGLVAVATDVGAWRVVLPVLRELDRRGVTYRVMLAEPAASIARQDGVAHLALTAGTPDDRADAVLAAGPTVLLLGTSVQSVVERAVIQRIRSSRVSVATLAVLDAMLFVERRFGAGLAELPDLVACPDEATATRLRDAGAPAAALVVTGNPTLEEIWLTGEPSSPDLPATPLTPRPPLPRVGEGETTSKLRVDSPSPAHRERGSGMSAQPMFAPRSGEGSPVDVLFVSSPVAAMRLRGAEFAIDEREALRDVLAALAALPELAPAGYRVRVRLHPVQRSESLPTPPPGIMLLSDDDPDRLGSCARARVVVGLSSTLLGEARFLSRPAVAYVPGPFWDRERVFAPEYGVPLARSRDHLQALIARALREPPAPPPLDGHLGAAVRIADLLVRTP